MLAFPLTAVMVLHATAVGMAFLTAIGSLPSLLFSLHAGAWVDQHGNRRRTMVVADAGRTLLLASIPAAFFLRILSIPLLIGLWFLVRTFSVFFRVASSTLFVSLVPKNRYVEANSLLHTSRATAFFVGPAIAGFLIQTLTAPVTLLADSLSFLTSAASLALIHPPRASAGPGAPPGPGWRTALHPQIDCIALFFCIAGHDEPLPDDVHGGVYSLRHPEPWHHSH